MIDKFNLSKRDLNKSIYRIFQIDRFLDSFISNTNDLVDSFMWEDPFENKILSIPRITKEGNIKKYEWGQFFGQSWTLNSETDFMWRVYTSVNEGIKVKTTISKLIQSIENSTEYKNNYSESEKIMMEYEDNENYDSNHVYLFYGTVGRIKYFREGELIKMNNTRKLEEVYFTNPLFSKRYEFSHEREVRIIIRIFDSDIPTYINEKVFSYQIDPNFLFDELVFDPRMNENRFNSYKMFLRKNGYKNKITKSNLYKLPFESIKVP